MPFIGASLFATIVGWVLDSVLAPWASIYVRVMAGLIVSTVAFYWGRKKLLDLRGD